MHVTTLTSERLAELRSMPYAAYLQTPEWRARRDRAVRRARYRCERCHGRGELQVHHRSYARIGAELDDDLEVLCDRDHRQEHIQELEAGPSGIYLRLARQVLRENPFFTIADVSDQTKWLCARHRISYDGPGINKAIGLLTGARVVPITISVYPPRDTIESIAVTAEIAHEILGTLGIPVGSVIRTLPDGFLPHEESVLEQVRRVRAEERKRPQTWEQRLQDIFAVKRTADDELVQRVRERAEIDEMCRRYGAYEL